YFSSTVSQYSSCSCSSRSPGASTSTTHNNPATTRSPPTVTGQRHVEERHRLMGGFSHLRQLVLTARLSGYQVMINGNAPYRPSPSRLRFAVGPESRSIRWSASEAKPTCTAARV